MNGHEIIDEVRSLASGTQSRIFGTAKYEEIERHVALFVEWVEAQPVRYYQNWQTATTEYVAFASHMTETVERIAKRYYRNPLQRRNLDELDFHEVACWEMGKALRAAVLAGMNLKNAEKTDSLAGLLLEMG